MKKLKEVKGITLVALIITIIILLILVGITIASLNGENGLMKKTRLAKQKYEISEAKEKIELAITTLRIEKEGKGESITKEDLPKINSDEIDVRSVESFPVEVICTRYKFNINENFNVNYVEEVVEETVITYTTEPEGYTNQDEIVIKIKFSNSIGIKKIEFPQGEEALNANGKKEVGIDYKVTQNGTYTFTVIDGNNSQITKDVVIDKIDTLPPLEFTPQIKDITQTGFSIVVDANDSEATNESTKSGIAKYEYYIKRTQEAEYTKYESKENSYIINNLNPGTEYLVYVIIYDGANNSASSLDNMDEISIRTQIYLTDINDQINTQDGLVSYWPLQGNLNNYASLGGTLNDGKGTANITSDSVYLSENYLYTTNNYNLTGNQTTFLQYKRTANFSTWAAFFGYEDPCSSVYDHNALYWDNYEKKVCLIVHNNYGNHISFDLNTVAPLNTWVNIVVTTDDTKTTVYMNGQKGSNTSLYSYSETTKRLCLGSMPKNIGGSGYYKNFGVFNRALSEEEIQNLFN